MSLDAEGIATRRLPAGVAQRWPAAAKPPSALAGSTQGAARRKARPAPRRGGDPKPGRRRQPGARAPAGGLRHEVADPQEADSYPAPASVHHAAAAAPVKAGRSGRRGGRAVGRRSEARARSRCRRSNSAPRQATARTGSRRCPAASRSAATARSRSRRTCPEAVQKVIAGRERDRRLPVRLRRRARVVHRQRLRLLGLGQLCARRRRPARARRRPRANWRAGARRARPLHHGVRERRAHLHVRGRDPVRHGRAQRRVRLTLAGRPAPTTAATSCATGPGSERAAVLAPSRTLLARLPLGAGRRSGNGRQQHGASR